MKKRVASILWRESGQTLPLVVGVVLLAVILLLTTFATTEMAGERIRQQGSADMAALAGANTLTKATETGRLIDFTIWARNATLDVMYLAATMATIGSAGAGAEAFAVPLKFQKATIKPVEMLEKTKTIIGEAAIIYSIANGARIVKSNDLRNSGLAIPMPLTPGLAGLSQRQKDLMKMIETYGQRIDQAKGEMDTVLLEYEKEKDRLKEDGLDQEQIKNHDTVKIIRQHVHEKSGRVGGLTTQRNRRRQELARLKNKQPVFEFGRDGVIGVVFHPSTKVPFTSAFGGIHTGNNLAMAAAAVTDGPPSRVIGEEAVANLFKKTPVLEPAAGALTWIMDSINIAGSKTRGLANDYGVIGGYISKGLGKIGLIPPSLSEPRPTLTRVDKVLSDSSQIYELMKKAESISGSFKDEHSLPPNFNGAEL